MAVSVQGDADAGIPQPLGDYLRVNAALEHECSVGMAQVMESSLQ